MTQPVTSGAARHPATRLGQLRFRALPWAILAMAGLALLKGVHLVQVAGGAPAAFASAGRAVIPPAHAAGAPAPAKQAAPAPAAAAAAVVPGPPAAPEIDPAERALLLDLRARRVVLEGREQAMSAREALQAAAEMRLNERVSQLTALQARLEKLDETRRERDDANWRGLVKTYETMRPRDAAAILNALDLPVLLQALDRTKAAKAALILAAMQPDRARSATTALAELRSRSVAAPALIAPALAAASPALGVPQ